MAGPTSSGATPRPARTISTRWTARPSRRAKASSAAYRPGAGRLSRAKRRTPMQAALRRLTGGVSTVVISLALAVQPLSSAAQGKSQPPRDTPNVREFYVKYRDLARDGAFTSSTLLSVQRTAELSAASGVQLTHVR